MMRLSNIKDDTSLAKAPAINPLWIPNETYPRIYPTVTSSGNQKAQAKKLIQHVIKILIEIRNYIGNSIIFNVILNFWIILIRLFWQIDAKSSELLDRIRKKLI